MGFKILLWILLTLSQIKGVHNQGGYSFADEAALRTLLFTSYNIQTRPDIGINVTTTLNLFSLNALDIVEQYMEIVGYINMEWFDSRLYWANNTAYNSSVPVLYVTDDNIWVPSVLVSNSVNSLAIFDDDITPIRVTKEGYMSWSSAGIYKTHCECDVTYYPFDTQTCELALSTWGYTSDDIILKFNDVEDPVSLDYYMPNGEWNYVSYSLLTTSSSRDLQSVSIMDFKLTFQRRPAFHVLNTIVPVVMIAFLSSMIFKLSPESGEKMGFVVTVLLAYAVYLTLVSSNMPTTSLTTSVLSVYLILIMGLSVLSVFITIYTLDCHYKSSDEELTPTCHKLAVILAPLSSWKGRSLNCCKKKQQQPKVDVSNAYQKGDVDTPSGERPQTRMQTWVPEKGVAHNSEEDHYSWQDFAEMTNIFFFRVYFTFITFTTIIFMVVLVIGYYTQSG